MIKAFHRRRYFWLDCPQTV